MLRLKNLKECDGLSGGAAIEKVAEKGDPKALPLVTILSRYRTCDFSFAGIKYEVKKYLWRAEKEQGDLFDSEIKLS